MIKIIVDTLGGDNSPYAGIDGALLSLKAISDVSITLVGNEEEISAYLKDKDYDKERLSILDGKDVIGCNDKPTVAIREKKESSLYKSFDLLKNGEDYGALVSTGSTGAILAGAVLKIGRIRGIKRPAFCPILPTMTGGIVSICDSGANVDCDATNLEQFAIMANLFLKTAYNKVNPKIALLNVGTEEEKGDLLRKEVFPILKNNPELNFVGNMEARDLLSGDYDVIVCDGFSGNVLLKAAEGACISLLTQLKGVLKKNLKTKLGALALKKDLYKLKDYMDYNNYGGAVLLGTAKTIVKGHGSSKALSVFHCIEQAYNMEKNGIRDKISEKVAPSVNVGE